MKTQVLKEAIAATGMKYRPLLDRVNRKLPEGQALTEGQLTKLATGRATPTPAQARALARVLRRKARDLFPKAEGGAA